MDLKALKQSILAQKSGDYSNPQSNDAGQNEYRLQMARLTQDLQSIKSLESIEAKASFKAKNLSNYLPWVNGRLDQDIASYDEVVMTMLPWALDAAEVDTEKQSEFYALAMRIFIYALKHEFALPAKYGRSLVTFVVESIADTALRANQDILAMQEVLQQIYSVTIADAQLDMIDQVRARLLKALAFLKIKLNEKNESQHDLALILELLEKADALDGNAGVKTKIKETKSALQKMADASQEQPQG